MNRNGLDTEDIKLIRLTEGIKDLQKEMERDEKVMEILKKVDPINAEKWMDFRRFSLLASSHRYVYNYYNTIFKLIMKIPDLREKLKGKKIQMLFRHDGSVANGEVHGPFKEEGKEEKFFVLITEANFRLKIMEVMIHELLHIIYPDWKEEEINQETKKIYEKVRIAIKGY
ncbi:MAG: hypothetical protein QW272_05335 [Candidatus Methanomethylicaceae archaeon]